MLIKLIVKLNVELNVKLNVEFNWFNWFKSWPLEGVSPNLI